MNNMGREIMAALKRFQTGSDGDGVTVGGSLVVSGSTTVNTFNVDVISEKTSAAGVTIDGVLLKDNGVVTGAGTVSAPVYSTTGDLNTGIFFPAADTIAFAEGGAEAMRIDSSGRVGIGTSSPAKRLQVNSSDVTDGVRLFSADATGEGLSIEWMSAFGPNRITADIESDASGDGGKFTIRVADTSAVLQDRLFIDNNGNVGIGTSSPGSKLEVAGVITSKASGNAARLEATDSGGSNISLNAKLAGSNTPALQTQTNDPILFAPNNTERMRITSDGNFLFNQTSASTQTNGAYFNALSGSAHLSVSNTNVSGTASLIYLNRQGSDGDLIEFRQADAIEGSISVSGNTVSYNAFCGGHWTQLQEGRGYNPDIPRGTVMSSIGEMAVWKSVEWVETVEHPAIEAVEAVEAVLDEDGNVIEPAFEAVEGKEAWTETFNKREAYLGNLDIGAIFEKDGLTKTVVDDGNERLPKVKISDVVGDKAVYGVFQTWDEVEDMLISSLGAFVVRIASGVTVEVGDLLESNGDGCAKVQDDDIIRSKTIGKVTSTVATDTYDDGSYTVPCVIYCG
jgi:hypothetical protein